MTDKEYRESLDALVRSGRAYTAIMDLTGMMQTYTGNVEAAMREMAAEKKAVTKIISNRATTVKERLMAIESMYT